MATAGSSCRSFASAACVAALLLSACGGSSPGPTPAPTPTPVVPPPNALPVVDSITIRGSRANEPANFADAGEAIVVTAKVHDDETAADQLQYAWTATDGTFTGTGATVTWTAPSSVPSTATVALSLKVTEKYGTGNAFEHSVDATSTLSLHDSIKEVGDMSRQFLLDFSDSSIRSPDVVIRNFSTGPRCIGGRASESEDVIKNRTLYQIESYQVDAAAVTVSFASRPCPFRPLDGDACAVVHTVWKSLCLQTNPECTAGQRTRAEGLDYVTAVYEPSQQWRLCASNYGPVSFTIVK